MKLFEDPLIVITGGAGFIGSCLVRHLNDSGLYNLVLVDDLGSTEKWKNLVGKRFLELIPKAALLDWLQGRESLVEAIIHLGARTDTMEKDAGYLFENNTRYAIRLAEYAMHHGQRFLYASSAATYGDGSQGYRDTQEELWKLEPLNAYAFSKQVFDQWVSDQGAFDRIVGLKFFNVFGPNELHKGKMASAISRMVPALARGEKISLFTSSDPSRFADGEQKRDFVYVKDVVRMITAFLQSDVTGLYNIGSGRASSWNQLARAVGLAMGKEPVIEYVEMPADLVGKYQNYSCADLSKTVAAIGKAAESLPLEKAVQDYVQNYLLLEKRW